jgi:hypothetical protein
MELCMRFLVKEQALNQTTARALGRQLEVELVITSPLSTSHGMLDQMTSRDDRTFIKPAK